MNRKIYFRNFYFELYVRFSGGKIERLIRVLQLLSEISDDWQVILLVCRTTQIEM